LGDSAPEPACQAAKVTSRRQVRALISTNVSFDCQSWYMLDLASPSSGDHHLPCPSSLFTGNAFTGSQGFKNFAQSNQESKLTSFMVRAEAHSLICLRRPYSMVGMDGYVMRWLSPTDDGGMSTLHCWPSALHYEHLQGSVSNRGSKKVRRIRHAAAPVCAAEW
jgi:hypothetical protein